MRTVMLICVGLLAFVAMEGVSYVTHRWVMHGPGMVWHRSHHSPSATRIEANDQFPVVFSAIGFGMFLVASLLGSAPLFWAAGGVTAYGLAYTFVHEVYIHRRVGVHVRDRRYLVWMRDSHQIHHTLGGEPYGMLLPVVSEARRAEAARREARRSSTRETRNRL